MITTNDITPLRINLGHDPTEHEILVYGRQFPVVLDMDFNFDEPEPVVTMKCRLADGLTLDLPLAVCYVGPPEGDHGDNVSTHRVQFALSESAFGFLQVHIDGELFPFTRLKIHAGIDDTPQVEITHLHRPFPTDGREPERWLLRGFITVPMDRVLHTS